MSKYLKIIILWAMIACMALPVSAFEFHDGVAAGNDNEIQVNDSGAMGSIPAAIDGQVVIGVTGAAPVFGTIADGEAIDTTLGAGTLGIAVEDASPTNKGAASFGASDFDVTAGNVAIDYTNGQAAATGVKGFLTGTDWDTFNGKATSGANNDITSMTGLSNDGIPLAKVANAASDGANSDITSLNGPALGTPASGTLTSCTGLPVSTGVSGLAANVATFLATSSSANLASALTDETGTLLSVFSDSPALTTVASITKTAIGVTRSDAYGLGILNTTAAAAGAQQYSPPLVFRGSGWKTDATAASQKVEFLMDVRPVQGAAAPTGYLGIYPSIADAAYSATPAIAVTSAGIVGIGTTAPDQILTIAETADKSGLNIRSSTTNDGLYLTSDGSGQAIITSGAEYTGTIITDANAWIARATSATGIWGHSGEIKFFTDPSLTPGNTFTPTQRIVIDTAGNIGIGATTFGTNAAKVLGIGNGTAPTTRPADMVQAWAADVDGTAGASGLHVLSEDGLTVKMGDDKLIASMTKTITGAVADGYCAGLRLTPIYTAATAQTVTRHNYIGINNVTGIGAGPAAITDGAVFRFDAATGTHKCLASPAAVGVTLGTGPTGANAGDPLGWMKINVNGTLRYMPYW